jgi:hypothetical protein
VRVEILYQRKRVPLGGNFGSLGGDFGNPGALSDSMELRKISKATLESEEVFEELRGNLERFGEF